MEAAGEAAGDTAGEAGAATGAAADVAGDAAGAAGFVSAGLASAGFGVAAGAVWPQAVRMTAASTATSMTTIGGRGTELCMGGRPSQEWRENGLGTLGNGLKVRTVEHPGVPVVTFVMQINGGLGADPAGREGLASLTADMVDEGTGMLSAIDISDALARIGAETLFSFKTGTRDLTLEKGSMLLQVPKGLGGAKIHTAAVTAAMTGTTIMIPLSRHTRWSSSPKPGAMWTTPVPSAVSTKSSASTRKAFFASLKYGKSGV